MCFCFIISEPKWPPFKMVLPPTTNPTKSSKTYNYHLIIVFQALHKMPGSLQTVEPSSTLLSSNKSTTFSAEALCKLDNSEWDRLTRSKLAEPVMEYLDKLLDKNDGELFYHKILSIYIVNVYYLFLIINCLIH